MATLRFRETTSAPPKTVFDILTDSARWQEWSDVPSSARIVDGADHPDGVGSVRRLGVGPLPLLKEEVLTYEAPSLYEYALIGGPPIRDYVGRVEITSQGEGSEIRWTVNLRAPISLPGADALVAAPVRLAIGRMVKALVKAAERA